MLYCILCYGPEEETASLSEQEDAELMTRMQVVEKRMAENGRLGPGVRLEPTATAATLRISEGEPMVIDGPFAETKEQLLGLRVLDCASLEDAVEAARHWAREKSSGCLEVRPVKGFYEGPL